MKIKVKEGSSIWKLATYWGTDDLPSNFCDLTRNVVFCFLVSFVFIIMISAWVGCVFATIAASISVGYVIWSVALSIFIGIIGLIFCCFLVEIQRGYFKEHPSERFDNVKIIYRSWKDKFCPLIEEIK